MRCPAVGHDRADRDASGRPLSVPPTTELDAGADPRLVAGFRWYSQVAGVVALAVGMTVLLGWALGVVALQRLASGLASMKPNTAVGLALVGLGLSLAARPPLGAPPAPRLRVAAAAGGLAATLGLLTLAEDAFGWDLRIDQLLFRHPAAAASAAPGRMAPTTAACLVLLGSSLVLAIVRRHRAAAVLSSAAAFTAFVAVLGYLCGVSSLYRVAAFGSMALHSALTILVTALGVLVLHPERLAIAGRSAGGVVVR